MANDKLLMQGNEACVQGALYAGMNFYAGYPITPSTELAELSAWHLPRRGGRFIQMEDEIGGIAAAIGASIAGAKAMTATSGPGFSLKQENIGYAVMAQVPLVIVNVQRGGPSTGLPTQSAQADIMQSRYGSHGDYPMIVLSPMSVRETFDLTVRAFNLAEKYRTPVMLLTDEVIGHMREGMSMPAPGQLEVIERTRPQRGEDYLPYRIPAGAIVAPMAEFGTGFRTHTTGLFYGDTGFPSNATDNALNRLEELFGKIEHHLDDILDYEEVMMEDAAVAVVSFGSTARVAKAAIKRMRQAGKPVGLFRIKTLWPSPQEALRRLAKRVGSILVCEMNRGQYVLEVERLAAGEARVKHLGRGNGEILTPEEIMQELEAML